MNWIKSIGSLAILSVAVSGNIVAQQTSSAVQVVTFGVSRTPQILAKSLASIGRSNTVSSDLISETLQPRLAKSSAKITFSANTSAAIGSVDVEGLSNLKGLSNKSELSTSGVFESNKSHQNDLRTFISDNKSSTLDVDSMVLTITD